MSVKTIDILGFGIAAVDDLIELDAFPANGSKEPVRAVTRVGGGQCTTALVAAARLGLRCTYAGFLGQNDLSRFTRDVLRAEGITVPESCAYPEARPYHSFILVDRATGERTILFSCEGVRQMQPDDVDRGLIDAARVLFIDQLGLDGMLVACHYAKAQGVPIVADLERDEHPATRDIMRLCDHLILPLKFAQAFTGERDPEAAVRALAADSARACSAVTDGVRGCWYQLAGESLVRHQPAFVVQVCDTTGCGDVFHGSYAAGIVLGMSVSEAMNLAAATAALKATRLGGQAGIPDRASVDTFIRERATASAGRG